MYANNFLISIISKSKDLTYKFDPKFEITNRNNDNHICPLSVQSLYKRRFDELLELDPLIPNYITFYNGTQYLIQKLVFDDIHLEKYRELISKYDTSNYIIIDHKTKIKYKSITLQNFMSMFNVLTYTIFKQLDIFNENTMIICKNASVHRSLSYYKKYDLYQKTSLVKKSITTYLQTSNTRKQYLEYTLDYYKDKNHILLPDKITTEYINNIQDETQFTTIIIDLPLLVKQEYLLVANNSSFNLLVSCVNLALKFLKTGGNLLISYYVISNELVLNFVIYLSKMFGDFNFVNVNELINMKDSEIMLFKNYNPDFEIIKELKQLNTTLLENDPSGGYDYRIINDEELHAYNLTKDLIPGYKYLTSLITFNNTEIIKKFYDKYKKYVVHKFEQKIQVLDNASKLYHERYLTDKIQFVLNNNKLAAINYTKKYHIGIVDWINQEDINSYFHESLLLYYENLKLCQYDILPLGSDSFKKSRNISSSYVDNFNTWSILSENAYEITEKVDKEKFKEVELFFNNRQKDLNKFLYKQLKVNINGRMTSRAWLKMQELLVTTNFFENIIKHNKSKNKDTIDSLHICEAPGNFINSCNYYVTNHTNMKYNWMAQSLQDSKIYDTYGFIQNNPERWDFYKGGDVTKYDNFMYYYNKYKGTDVLISDCGTEWITDADTNTFHKELSVYEMFYGLLIPRIGGNFIMKTIASNYNKQFVSLVYVATIKYEKVYIFKSNNNFWSQEIYVVGIGNKGFSEEESNILLDILKELEDAQVYYPVSTISDDFCIAYNQIMVNVLDQFKTNKKLFTFLIDYDEVFEENNKKISNIVYKKNAKWLSEFMSHLSGASKGYYKLKGKK